MPAGRLLKSSLFDDIRDPEMEKPAKKAVELKIDAPEFYDYPRNKVVGLSKDDLKDLILEEIELFKSS